MIRRQRTEGCGQSEARQRLRKAREFLDAAELLLADSSDVATSNAVLAGIAAVDALCCQNLGEHAKEHSFAPTLVRSIRPRGVDAANALERLLRIKNRAQYDARSVRPADAEAAIQQARRLVEIAEAAVPS